MVKNHLKTGRQKKSGLRMFPVFKWSDFGSPLYLKELGILKFGFLNGDVQLCQAVAIAAVKLFHYDS